MPKATERKPWQNPELRAKYKMLNPMCEVSEYFPHDGSNVLLPQETFRRDREPQFVSLPKRHPAHDVHHIIGRLLGNRRHDEWCNFLSCCRTCHAWLGAFRADGICISLYAKMHKRGYPEPSPLGEFEYDRLCELIGDYRRNLDILAWTKKLRWGFTQHYRDELLSRTCDE